MVSVWFSSSSFLQSYMCAMFMMTKSWTRKGSLLLCGVFLFVLLANLVGLFPFVFPSSTMLWFSFGMALPLWLYLILSGVSYDFKKFFAHFTPEGAPSLLVPLLVIIESVSVMIRPITLAIRLIANISAGHIILNLVAVCLSSWGPSMGSLAALCFSIFYSFFEVFVSIIQAYIFTLLLALYSNDHP
nr:ATP synthase 6 [Physella acuta]CAH2593442.1 ATP synthase 6 [Physella acuta]CAH2593664.1 ATP synthase 6 [Physella acuta]CAH2593723.1 ATP synthase 6 [Physella acuta]CAH2594054.1 ATP synthase 6 [Physella acuta]